MALPAISNDPDRLVVHSSSPTSKSLDGETLRSRPASLQTASDFTPRTRANSTNTAVSRQPSLDLSPPEEALKPDKGSEPDFFVHDNPFAFSPGQLNKLLNPKSLSAFWALGGLSGLEKGLRTDALAGLSLEENRLDGKVSFEEAHAKAQKNNPTEKTFTLPVGENTFSQGFQDLFSDRLRVFCDNRLPAKKPANILVLIWRNYKDKILIILTIAAVISLALGLYQTFVGGSDLEWIEGVAICIAIFAVVTVGAANDWQMERKFVRLNQRKDDREVKVVRSGKSMQLSVHDITAGDVIHLEPGDSVPADGIFISGHGVKCDESSATGESDQMKKTGGLEVKQQILNGTASNKLDPFIISGSKVLEGVGTYLVTSVGQNSSYGKILMGLQTETEPTPLQIKLGRLANWIGGLGSAAAILLLLVLTFKFVAGLSSNENTPLAKGQQFLDILIVAITIIVVAVPEGLPLAVTLALAFATTRMLKENNLVRVLRACETMGNATTICSDKTGTLTQNKMTVVSGAWGLNGRFAQSKEPLESGDEVASFTNIFSKLSTQTRALIRQSITLNSTAFEGQEDGVATFIGSKTETAMLILAREHLGLGDLAQDRANAEVIQLIPFDSTRKCMGVVIRLDDGTHRLFVKGAAEIMLGQASQAIADLENENLGSIEATESFKCQISELIEAYARQSLRTIGFLYKDFQQWPPKDAKVLEEDKNLVDFDDVIRGMTWIGVIGIHDPLREGVVQAVAQCQKSGVIVRMVTGDNVTTARAIATDCGIMAPDAIVMEGPEFRQLDDHAIDGILPRLRVLARSSPEDKRILVSRLKHLGETVAVTGDGTNDGPALRTADVGFSMGIAGTEVAKEASSIILLDDNFSSTITALMWGRAVNDAVKKFLQFQITVNITAVLLTFVSAVTNPVDYHSVLTAVQLLWVNLIMDTLAALALATDPPTKTILNRPPQPKSEAIITINMWKMIIGQAVYQLTVTFVLYFAGTKILNYANDDELATMIFNTFVWMQLFNVFNNRRLDNKFNVFEGVHRNFWFLGISCIMVAGQIMIVFIGGEAFSISPLNAGQWATCLLCALPCVLWAVIIRLFPDDWFAFIFNGCISGVGFVLGPFVMALRFIHRPFAQGWQSFTATIGRLSQRFSPKAGRLASQGGEDTSFPAHEEPQMSSDLEKNHKEKSMPLTYPPPITLTTAD